MALRDIMREEVELALKEFDSIGVKGMIERYSGGRSTNWYIQIGGRRYDQKLICRAAHEHQGLGPLPSGRGDVQGQRDEAPLEEAWLLPNRVPDCLHAQTNPDSFVFDSGSGSQ